MCVPWCPPAYKGRSPQAHVAPETLTPVVGISYLQTSWGLRRPPTFLPKPESSDCLCSSTVSLLLRVMSGHHPKKKGSERKSSCLLGVQMLRVIETRPETDGSRYAQPGEPAPLCECSEVFFPSSPPGRAIFLEKSTGLTQGKADHVLTPCLTVLTCTVRSLPENADVSK